MRTTPLDTVRRDQELEALAGRLEGALDEVERALAAARGRRWRAPDPLVLVLGQAVIMCGRLFILHARSTVRRAGCLD